MVTFIVCAYASEVLFFRVYSSLYADADGELTTRASVLGMFACIPIVAAISGWVGAAAAKLVMRYIDGQPEETNLEDLTKR